MFSQTNTVAQIIAPPIGDISLTGCNNSGFEDNNFGNWETFVGGVTSNFGGVNLASFNQTLDPTQHVIVNNNIVDFYGNYPVTNCGTKAAKIGDIIGGKKSSMIKYTFTVNSINANFSFRYAMVLQDPDGHSSNQKPFFQYLILKGDRSYFTNASQIVTTKKFIANRKNPFFTYTANDYVYKDWSTECVDLSNYIGQEISILFITADCAFGAHGGYAYVDCLCKNNEAVADFTIGTDFCINTPIILDGTASVNEDSYFIGISELPWIPGNGVNGWFTAQQAGVIDINSLANQWGYPLKCNTSYNIKLAVKNNCTSWNETSKTIFVRCPDYKNLGDDIVMCCDNIQPVILGHEQLFPINTYNWTSSPPWLVPNPNLPSFPVTPTQSATFNVTVTDDYGCVIEDEIDIIIEQDFTVTITEEDLGCCKKILVPHVTLNNCSNIIEEDPEWQLKKLQQLSYKWSDGSTDKDHIVSPTKNTTYSLTVSNNCYSHTVSINVTPNKIGNFPTVIAPNAMIPNSNIPANRKLIIREFGLNAPQDGKPAYNAKEYLLEIYNRWGNRVRTITGGGCQVLQGEIQWDGKSNFGNLLPTGVYVWKLYFKNCTHSSWKPACHSYSNTNTQGWCSKYCIKWTPFPKNVCCKQWNDPCAYRITLLR